MFVKFFSELKQSKIPVSLREYLNFLDAVQRGLADFNIDMFYYLARTSLIKHEKNIDKFDQVFASVFGGAQRISLDELFSSTEIPNDWIKKLSEKFLSAKEKKEIKGLGGFEKLMDTLKHRLKEQEKRHQGGNKWIGTAGTSPFGAYGYSPEGIRIGQNESRHQKAVKVWDKRNFKDFDDNSNLGSRGMKIALKRLRLWARTGIEEEFDLDQTITATAKNGYLDVKTRPEKLNSVKVLLFFDIGGSMDAYIRQIQELFSASKSAFKHMEYYYFHNCLYEAVWKENIRRWTNQTPTHEILRTYSSDYKCIFVGDAAMSPYEIEMPGGANEHYNKETGRSWLERAITQWPRNLWINPIPEEHWDYSQSTQIINSIFGNRMVPLTMKGLESGMKLLT
ncbi:MAG: VWA domain-containing protein [Paracoccaceae bacterium]|nr:VWA domain-containing protein [Paracoccaceae bacterium]